MERRTFLRTNQEQPAEDLQRLATPFVQDSGKIAKNNIWLFMTDLTLKDTLHFMSETLFVVYLGHCFLWTNPSLLGPILSFLGEVRAERHLRVQPGQRHCLLRRTTW